MAMSSSFSLCCSHALATVGVNAPGIIWTETGECDQLEIEMAVIGEEIDLCWLGTWTGTGTGTGTETGEEN